MKAGNRQSPLVVGLGPGSFCSCAALRLKLVKFQMIDYRVLMLSLKMNDREMHNYCLTNKYLLAICVQIRFLLMPQGHVLPHNVDESIL